MALPQAVRHFTVSAEGVPVSVYAFALAAATPDLLSPDEIARAERLKFAALRTRFIAARTGLRLILSAHTGVDAGLIRFSAGAYGKPALLDDPAVHFNLSHSDELALVAVAPYPVGIDLEIMRPLAWQTVIRTAEIGFSAEELATLHGLPASERVGVFYRIWTRKEALMKGIGDGFRLTKTFSVPHTGEGVRVGEWLICDCDPMPGAAAALAVHRPL
ncbi:MAG: 4'-phosphopantetheinyl transferase superfamily protein [bacterium]|nr:4'-phosphopantetheinyl transferase superfamily protein [bacterium]